MAYDEAVDQRVQRLIADWNPERKKMFGGTCYLIAGNMLCGVNQDLVILRVDKDDTDELLRHPAVGAFGMTGRRMAGFLEVPSGAVDDEELSELLQHCHDYVRSLPPK